MGIKVTMKQDSSFAEGCSEPEAKNLQEMKEHDIILLDDHCKEW